MALAAVVRDLRDIPRELIGDPAEVVHFLGRAARRLEGIRAMRVPVVNADQLLSRKPPSAVLMAPAQDLHRLEGDAAARAATESTFSEAAKVSARSATSSTLTRKSAEPDQARGPVRPSASRLVVGRRGQPVPVVLRRARAAGQIELPI